MHTAGAQKPLAELTNKRTANGSPGSGEAAGLVGSWEVRMKGIRGLDAK